ncbi:MAG: sensor histidine kinase [Nitrospiraceae bacterium]|nr:MAG: sensor histidine kinase [Nitrospiraceae bacterium]
MSDKNTIHYDHIIGADKDLKEILKGADLTSLLQSSGRSGVSYCAVEDAAGEVLYRYGTFPLPAEGEEQGPDNYICLKKPIYFEGEIFGYVVVSGNIQNRNLIEIITGLIHESTNTIIKSSYRALLATETHKTVVHQSYEALLETNRKLTLSESRYRNLADSLEQQVRQRTEELKHAHAKLLHQEKIASVGQLAAGIAHEINNPLGFILSNMNTLKQYVAKMSELLIFYRAALARNMINPGDMNTAEQQWKKYKLDIILSDIDTLMMESISGAERVKKIVSDLKGFSHIDETHKVDIDINKEIERTLNVLIHEILPDTEIIKDYSPLPPFTCNPADICQSFFNIILNAFQTREQGLKLVIATEHADGYIRIRFTDNGPGIPEEIRNRLFEPFFTTKEVGKGTGMGLNVAYEIVTSYGGAIEVGSVSGEGSTFSITLPLSDNASQRGHV